MSILPGVMSSRRRSGGGGALITWTARTSQFGTKKVTAIWHDGTTFAISGESGYISSSADGETWVQKSTSALAADDYANGLAKIGSNWVIGGWRKGYIKSSTDLITWASRVSTDNMHCYIGTSNGTKAIMAGYDYSTWGAADVSNSSDGVSWTNEIAIPSCTGGSEGICQNTNKVVVTNRDKSYPIAYSSDDGDTWTTVSKTVTQEMFGIACNSNGTKYVATGANGYVMTSTNGTSWTIQTAISTSETLYGVGYDGSGKWVAVGSAGVAFESTNDGVSWSTSNSTQVGTEIINNIIYAESKWVLVANDGKVSTGV